MELEGKTFCLSGVFSKLDYLFVGGSGSAAEKFGKISGKIAKAMELQEKEAKVRIFSEDELMEIIS